MLDGMHYVLQLALTSESGLQQKDRNLLAGVPTDPETVFQHFNLEGRQTIFTVCPNPTCHSTYAPTFTDGSPIARYPTRCTRRAFGSPCHEYLVRTKSINNCNVLVPIKTYVYFDFKDWLAGLLSRPGMEEKMDGAWRETTTDNLHDVFDGSVLRDFRGANGKHFSCGGDEGHYVFSLCCDFFNPLGNKQAGKKKSIGMIALVCLNLPPDLRYKPENMFLAGVVPGPNEPPLDCINPYLKPIVDDFLEFWDTPVRFSRTCDHPDGRGVRCALVAVVCDLPAARKVGGFAAHSHKYFCSICLCHKDRDGSVNTPRSEWQRRSNKDCRDTAVVDTG
jgi:Transposase family tnp2